MAEIDVIQNDIEHIKNDVSEIKSDIKEMKNRFVPTKTFYWVISVIVIGLIVKTVVAG